LRKVQEDATDALKLLESVKCKFSKCAELDLAINNFQILLGTMQHRNYILRRPNPDLDFSKLLFNIICERFCDSWPIEFLKAIFKNISEIMNEICDMENVWAGYYDDDDNDCSSVQGLFFICCDFQRL